MVDRRDNRTQEDLFFWGEKAGFLKNLGSAKYDYFIVSNLTGEIKLNKNMTFVVLIGSKVCRKTQMFAIILNNASQSFSRRERVFFTYIDEFYDHSLVKSFGKRIHP